MSRVNPQELREAGEYLLAASVIFYLGLSALEPQKVLWRKPRRNALIVFIAVWTVALVFIASALLWSR